MFTSTQIYNANLSCFGNRVREDDCSYVFDESTDRVREDDCSYVFDESTNPTRRIPPLHWHPLLIQLWRLIRSPLAQTLPPRFLPMQLLWPLHSGTAPLPSQIQFGAVAAMVEIMEVAAVGAVTMVVAGLPIVAAVMGAVAVAVMATGMMEASVLAAVATAAMAMLRAT
jgi:hypothetical protein